MDATPEIEVFYDGECPVCRWEVRLYSRMDKLGKIRWTDIIGLSPQDLPNDKLREDLLGRFHVRDLRDLDDTHLSAQPWHIGVDAFARIWRVLPGLRCFSGLFVIPGIRQLTMVAYRLFLIWQRNHRRRRHQT